MSPDEVEDDVAEETGQPTKSDILAQAMRDMMASNQEIMRGLVAELQRPKRLTRDMETGEKIVVPV